MADTEPLRDLHLRLSQDGKTLYTEELLTAAEIQRIHDLWPAIVSIVNSRGRRRDDA